MKNVFNIGKLFFLAVLLLSCEVNDEIEELSSPGVFTPNVYFEPINPTIASGATIETEVEYWSPDDEFVAIEMLQTVFLEDEISLNLDDVNYEYSYAESRDKLEDDLIQSIPHNFNAFVPSRNAYIIMPEYEVPADFKKQRLNSGNTTAQALSDALPEEAKEDFYRTIAAQLSKEQLQTILVEVDSVVSLSVFETYFDGPNFTTDGRAQAIEDLKLIGLPGLIASDFEYTVTHRVALFFRIENGLGGINRSVARVVRVN